MYTVAFCSGGALQGPPVLDGAWSEVGFEFAQPKPIYLNYSQIRCLKSLTYPLLLATYFLLYPSQLTFKLFPIH